MENSRTIGTLLPIFLTLSLAPLLLPLATINGKPINITFLDIASIFAFFCFLFFTKQKVRFEVQITSAILIMITLFFLLAVTTVALNNSVVPILSWMKYSKPFLAIFVGFYLARKVSLSVFWRASYIASSFIAFALLFSLENVYGRWGNNIFGIDIDGFPNSSSQYYIILIMFCFGYIAERKNILFGRAVAYVAVAILALFIIFSLSRSALTLLLLLLLGLFFASRIKFKFYAILLALTSFLVFVNSTIDIFQYTEGLETRFNRTFNSIDFSSGRLDLALEVYDLMEENPMLGYGFSSFSEYHEKHSTPHNQYLESLFKTGLVGFLIYNFIILILYLQVFKKYKRIRRNRLLAKIKGRQSSEDIYLLFLFVFWLVMIGNISQPNITYNYTGNVLMLLLGFLSTTSVRQMSK